MTFHTDKGLKSKNFRGKKVYITVKDIDSKRKFKIKSRKMSVLKRPNFWGHPYSGSCVQKRLDSFTKYFLLMKYQNPEKISLFTLQRADIYGGPPVLFVCKIPPS